MLPRKPLAVLKMLGPGLIAGASDNDPTTVATLAVIGSTTGFALLWLVALTIPMLVVVQVISARVGAVCRDGLEDLIRVRFGRPWAIGTLLLVLGVNVLTLAADLEGGAAALGLLVGMPYTVFVGPFALAVAALLIWGSYTAMERVLRYVLLVFLTYIAAAVLAHPPGALVLYHTVVPHFRFTPAYVSAALALLGTTLTSYAYVWETIEEAEKRPPLQHLGLIQLDAGLGMLAAGVIFYFIVVCTGATLGAQHKVVQTAQDAAAALAPVAGPLAATVFGIGLLASAMLAVPVLAGTSAYVIAQAFDWRGSLDAHFSEARAFYLALLASLGAGVGITLYGVGPIQLLFFSSIVGGLSTPVTLAFLLLVARDRGLMRTHHIGRTLAVAGWLVFVAVSGACGVYLWQTFAPGAA